MQYEIEWGVDLDKLTKTMSIGDGPAREFRTKVRCQECWGGALGRTGDDHEWNGIKCRVCGAIFEGEAAKDEMERISIETTLNLMNADFGHGPKSADGAFREKIFWPIDRLSESELEERAVAKRYTRSKRKILTRGAFPVGAPGLFLFQAQLLVEGVDQNHDFDDLSVVDFPDVEIRGDGSASMHVPTRKLTQIKALDEEEQMSNMGRTLARAMMSAFACELVLKAISLTCNDEARKSHDLLELYNELPGSSRSRISADLPEMENLLGRGRHTFGEWRYFEMNVGSQSLISLLDVKLANELGKAARILLDEGEIVGLAARVTTEANRKVTVNGQRQHISQSTRLSVAGGEAPPR